MTTESVPARPRPTAAVDPALVRRLTADVIGGDTTSCHAPFTGERLADLPAATVEEVGVARDRARAAQSAWAARPPRERAAVLLRFHDLLLDRQDEVLDLVQLETGKSRLHAHEEVQSVALVARHYGRRGPAHLRPRRHTGAVPGLTTAVEHRRPRGLVGVIAPWNYPLELTVGDALPALVAGNAVLMKPDTETALTALWARRLLIEAGLPPTVWQIVLGDGPVVGPAVIAVVDHLSFTGSTRTGRQVARAAGDRLIGVDLELGGKNPMIVLEDADPDRAAEGAVRACFTSAGQLCVSIERLLVHERIADAFLDRLLTRTAALRMGPGLDWDIDLGSLSSGAQLEVVTRHVTEAVAGGARILAGGRPRPDLGPWFHEPTVLEGVTPDMAVHAEETFGPVVAVHRFTDDEEALRLADAGRYGLNASVWGRDIRRARALAARLRTGTVNINEGYGAAYGSVRAPMGGMGDSGVGRRHGAEGILRFTEAQTIARQRLLPLGPSMGMDNRAHAALMTRALRLMKRVGMG
ncbi:succinic semialdehyde dehydrogenase [Streptomyces sp. ST2-7A]|uniref:succinic semialdehyde dehydrogenase n=1 Tax=Streptomyces sp. ST2-7A TaxID=2907214 RepID=UPI001EE9B0CD|nr:succinic semialdehyde dehydrogenase [Streptomyces sp. ST2-7A]MCE7078744.1 succinate-semialdehyde dehydrogenase (NADP(+)) [Streptomyces sp. ST2-7A]